MNLHQGLGDEVNAEVLHYSCCIYYLLLESYRNITVDLSKSSPFLKPNH